MNIKKLAAEIVALTEYAANANKTAKYRKSDYHKNNARMVANESLEAIAELEQRLSEVKATLRKIAG